MHYAMKKDSTKKDGKNKRREDAMQGRCNVHIAEPTNIHTQQDAIFSTKDPNHPPLL